MKAHYCRKVHLWGGIAVFLNINIQTQIDEIKLNEISQAEECLFEALVINIKLKKENITLLTAYRSPNTKVKDFLDKLENSLQQLTKKKTNIVILGDTNLDILKPEDKNINDLSNLLSEYGCYIVHIPETRTTATTSSSIDGCYTNLEPGRIDVTAHKNPISDHHTVICDILGKIYMKGPLYKNSRHFTRHNIDEFKRLLSQTDWQNIYTFDQIDEKYNEFLKIMKLNLDQAIPKTTRKMQHKNSTVFWNEDVKIKRQELQTAQKKYEQNGSVQERNNYYKLKIDYDHLIRTLRCTHVITKIQQSENKTKEIWRTINTERGKTNQEKPEISLLQDDNIVNDPYEITNILNTFFINPIKEQNQHSLEIINNAENPDSTNNMHTKPSFSKFKLISEDKLIKLFSHIKSNNAAGYDEISGKLIKHCRDEIIKPLLHIINTSLTQNLIPQNLKISKIYPKFKKGNKQDPGNYRPISNLPTVSKLLERVIYDQIISHLEENKMLTICQHGFRKGRGTNTAIAKLCEDISTIWETRQNASGLFLDLQKAFDTLNWDILLQKLKKVNIKDEALELIENYLSHRYQYVEIDHQINNVITTTKSSLIQNTQGIPQGSILGPLFFLIFINDLPEKLSEEQKCILFADDTTIIIPTDRGEDNQQRINETVEKVTTICNNLKLKLNTTKTTHINFTPNNNQVHREEWTNLNISTQETTKFLGIIVDKNLTWNKHTEYLCKRLASAHYAIKRIRTITNENTSVIAYHSLFASHIRYGISTWGSAAHSNMEKILILQKKTLRTICRKPYLEHCKPLFIQLKILTVFSQYILETIILVKKSNTITRSQLHNHNTRHKNNINLPQHRLKKFSNTPTYTGSKFINLLPDKIKNILNYNTFLKTIKQYFINRPYYSIQEYIDEHAYNTHTSGFS